MTSQLDLVLSKLDGVKKLAFGYVARCPTHDDKHQSLSVNEEDGKLLLYCHAGCSFERIIKALDLPPLKQEEPIVPVIVDTYDYEDALTGKPYQVVRYKPKAFKQRQPGIDGVWVWNKDGITPNLFHRKWLEDAIQLGKMVFIVEGEKDVLSLMRELQVATSISGGASTKWHPSLVPIFQGANVVIIPDSDEPGRKYATYVANLLYGWCASLKVISLPCKDVSDYLASTDAEGEPSKIQGLLNIVDNTKQYIPQGAVTREEHNELRGMCIYLLKELRKRKSNLEWS